MGSISTTCIQCTYMYTPHVVVYLANTGSVQVLLAATEQFNTKPKQGITFLQERGIVSASSSPEYAEQIASFLVDNPRLSKAMIGEFIGDRKNPAILAAFVK